MTDSPSAHFELRVPPEVLDVSTRVRAAGGRALVVGGAVRDAALGRRSLDYDLALSLAPDRVLELFPGADALDASLGTVRLPLDGGVLVLTTFREESDYDAHRRPGRVHFVGDPARDASRRDFTVNAIYFDPLTGEVLDPCGGLRDLAARRLATIGEPEVRFTEDPLRLLRAIRFAAACDLEVDPATAAGLQSCAPLLDRLSHERVYDELTRAFTGRGRGRALRLLITHGLAAIVLPEVVAMDGVPQPPEYHPEGDVLTHVCLVLDHVPEADPALAWAAVLHDVGKPPTFERAADRIRFTGHDTLSASMADGVLRRLHAPSVVRELVVEICRDHIRIATLPEMTATKRERWLRTPSFPAHLAFHRADCLGSHRKLQIHDLAERWLAELPPVPPPPLCTGKDVLALGVAPGPEVGRLLRVLEERLETMPTADRSTALSILAELVAAGVKARDS